MCEHLGKKKGKGIRNTGGGSPVNNREDSIVRTFRLFAFSDGYPNKTELNKERNGGEGGNNTQESRGVKVSEELLDAKKAGC